MSENNESHSASDSQRPQQSNTDGVGDGSRESALKAEDALRLIVQGGEAPSSHTLWSHLSPAARLEFERQIARLDPAALQFFSLVDLALLAQWLFAQHDIETLDITGRDGGLDLTLFNLRHNQEEFARLYEEAIPPGLFEELSQTLEGREITKVRICTTGLFTEEHWKVQREFPSLLEFWDREALAGYLREAQLVHNSPRIQSRRVLPARKIRRASVGRRRLNPPQKTQADPARLKAQFLALSKPKYLSEKLLTAGIAITGLAFAVSLLAPWPGAMQAAIPLGAAVIAMTLLRLYTGHRRRERFRQLWSLLNSSSDAFEIGMPHIFRMIGYQVERVGRYRGPPAAENRGGRGIVVQLKRRRRTLIAYCASPPLVLTAFDIGVRETEMEKHNTPQGMVVVRGVFSLAAIKRARLDQITLVEGRTLRDWIK